MGNASHCSEFYFIFKPLLIVFLYARVYRELPKIHIKAYPDFNTCNLIATTLVMTIIQFVVN